MSLGFSYIGFIYLAMLLLPNFLWMKNKPKDYESYVQNENGVLLALERAGEVSVSCLALIFTDFNIKPWSGWSWWLVLSFLWMVLYEVYWIRYFRSEKTMKDFYSSLLGVPVAGATLPVAGFFFLAIYGKNILLMLAVSILGVGHIGIHLGHLKEIKWTG